MLTDALASVPAPEPLLRRLEELMMEHTHATLAEQDGFGRIYRCGNCEHIHLQIGPVSLTLTLDAYMQFVSMVHTSAANFEATASWRPENAQ
jgi:hypothetical protein